MLKRLNKLTTNCWSENFIATANGFHTKIITRLILFCQTKKQYVVVVVVLALISDQWSSVGSPRDQQCLDHFYSWYSSTIMSIAWPNRLSDALSIIPVFPSRYSVKEMWLRMTRSCKVPCTGLKVTPWHIMIHEDKFEYVWLGHNTFVFPFVGRLKHCFS